MPAAGVVLIVAVVMVVLALVYYLVSTILALRQIVGGLNKTIAAVGEIVEKSAPVNDVVTTINENLDAAVDALEGLLVKKAGLEDAIGLIDGLYPGAGAAGLRNYEGSGDIKPPRIAEIYTKGTLTLARLGREAPIAAKSPDGPAIRDVAYASLSARKLYPEASVARPVAMFARRRRTSINATASTATTTTASRTLSSTSRWVVLMSSPPRSRRSARSCSRPG